MKDQILESGLRLVHERGFASASVRDITEAAGVPKGSFFNHFESKDEFGKVIIGRYFEDVERLMEGTLGNHALPPSERLSAFVSAATEKVITHDSACGCLLGNLTAEMSTQNEELRVLLRSKFDAMTARMSETVAAAQDAAEIRRDLSAADIADVVMNAFEGAILRVKVERSRAPLDQMMAFLAKALKP